jgi:hypothetical protein
MTKAKSITGVRRLAIAGAAIVASTAYADQVSVKDIDFSTRGSTKAEKVKDKDAVHITGGDKAVTLNFASAKGKAGANTAVSSFSVGLLHVDKGAHAFNLAFGKIGSVSIQCNDSPPQLGAKSGEHFATFTPSFDTSGKYSVSVLKDGKEVQSAKAQTGAFTVKNFDAEHAGQQENVGFSLTYGTVRKGAWTMTITHEGFTVVITSDTIQKRPSDAAEMTIKFDGLDDVTLTDPRVVFTPPDGT